MPSVFPEEVGLCLASHHVDRSWEAQHMAPHHSFSTPQSLAHSWSQDTVTYLDTATDIISRHVDIIIFHISR